MNLGINPVIANLGMNPVMNLGMNSVIASGTTYRKQLTHRTMMTPFVPRCIRVLASSPSYQFARTGCFTKSFLSSGFASQKNVITRPKNFPGRKSSQSSKRYPLKKKSVQVSRLSERSEVSSNGTDNQYLTHTEHEKHADGRAEKSFQGEPRIDSGVRTSHFLPTDLGLSGTFIIKEKHIDKVVEDVRITTSAQDIVGTEMQALQRNFGPEKDMRSEDLDNTHEEIISSELTETQKPYHGVNKPSSYVDGKGGGSQESAGNVGLQENVAVDGMEVEQQLEFDTMMDSKQLEAATTEPNEIGKDKTLKWKSSKHFKKKLKIGLSKEVLYGISPCLLALQQDRREIAKAFALDSFKSSARSEAQEIIRLLSKKGVEVREANRVELNKLSQGRPHQGICLEVSPLRFEHLSKITGELMATDSPTCLLALDQILDPMNLGALMRSAYFLGVDKVVACKHKCCPLTPTVSKASSGITEVMPLYSAANMARLLQELSDLNWLIVGATNMAEGQTPSPSVPVLPCGDLHLTRPTVLIIGSEGFGLRGDLRALCHQLVTIHPGRRLHQNIDSLNVSVATGIILHSLLVKR